MRSREQTIDDVGYVLQEFLPVEVVSFLKEMLDTQSFLQYDRDFVVDTLIRLYQQNIQANSCSITIRQNASAYLAYLGTQRAIRFLEQSYEQEQDKWVPRWKPRQDILYK